MAKTLSALRTEAQYLSDQVDATFISNAEWLVAINNGLSELYYLLIDLSPENFVASSAESLSIVSGTHTYSLASDHYRIYGVDLVVGSYTYNIEPHNFRERNKWQNSYVTNSLDEAPMFRYSQPTNDKIRLTPTPSGSYTVNVWYIPSITELSSDSDTTPAAIENHWLKYVTTEAAIHAKIKAEEDPSALMRQKQQVLALIENSMNSKLTQSTHYATDTNRGNYTF